MFIFASRTLFKNDENYFLFHLKNFLFLRYLNFCPDFFRSCTKTDKKTSFNFKIYDVVNWEKNNDNIHIDEYLKLSKGKQTMKFGQLVEYNVKHTFL